MAHKVEPKVTLLAMTPDAVNVIYAACRQCYSSDSAAGIFNAQDKTGREEFIRKIVASGHESTLEHVSFTFALDGVSRALTHQLVRHRIASYSQQSQRYVKAEDYGYIVPPSIAGDDKLRQVFLETIEIIQENYNRMMKVFKSAGQSGEKVNQDLRFILPQAAETKIVVTMNCRELLHFFSLRCCSRAQWEIRSVANMMLAICRKKLGVVFLQAGEKCARLKYCPEGEKFSCGKYPVK